MSTPQDTSVNEQIYLLNYQPNAMRLGKRLKAAGFTPTHWPGSAQADPTLTRFYDLSSSIPHDLVLSPDCINILLITSAQTLGDVPENADIILTDLRQIETLEARLKLSRRERRRIREKHLRQQTLQRLKPVTPPPQADRPKRLLWLGPEAHFLNPLKSMLKDRGIELWAAISAYTAKDYLNTHEFDLIGLYPKRVDDEVMRLLNTLMAVPQPRPWRKVLILEAETNALVSGEAVNSADLILDTTANLENLTEKLAEIAHNNAAAVESHGPKATQNTLATREYLETHVAAQMRESDNTGEPLTLVGLFVPDPDQVEPLVNRVMPLLRESDLAARIEASTLALSLPGTNFRGGSKLVKRLRAETDFDVEARVIQKREYHTAKTIIGGLTALTGLRRQRNA